MGRSMGRSMARGPQYGASYGAGSTPSWRNRAIYEGGRPPLTGSRSRGVVLVGPPRGGTGSTGPPGRPPPALLREVEAEPDAGALARGGLDAEVPAQRRRPIPHGREAATRRPGGPFRIEPMAVVLDHKLEAARLRNVGVDADGAGPPVARGVVEGLFAE